MPQLFFLPPSFTNISFTFAPMQLHALVLASFASLIAPFGGFFASGLKRSFKIKDFGDSIPGHGGMTDRMDCQFIMGFFAYMYYHTFISLHKVNVGTVLETAITSLSPEEQIELVKSMSRYLGNQGVVSEKVSLSCCVAQSGEPKLTGGCSSLNALSEQSAAKRILHTFFVILFPCLVPFSHGDLIRLRLVPCFLSCSRFTFNKSKGGANYFVSYFRFKTCASAPM